MLNCKKNIVYAILAPVLLMVILWNILPFVYAIVDDRTMMEIVSGQYLGRADAHIIFVGYWYSLLIQRLYMILPNVDWYALGYLFLQSVCISLVLYRLHLCQEAGFGLFHGDKKSFFEKIWSWVVPLLLVVILCLRIIVQITFTTTATILGMTIIFWYLTTKTFQIKDLLILGILCLLTMEIRASVFLMVLPVCVVLWLFRILNKRERTRNHLLVPLVVVLAFLLEIPAYSMGYGSKEWRDFSHYTNLRSLVYDYEEYGFPRFEEEEAFYRRIGIEKKSRAKNLYYYNFTADDRITPDFFEQYVKEKNKTVLPYRMQIAQIWKSVREYSSGIVHGKFGYHHNVILLFYILLAFLWICKKDYQKCLRVICVLGVQILLWIYLVYRGRLPERVLFSMNFMLLTTLILLWAEFLVQLKLSVNRKRIFALVVLPICIILAFVEIKTVRIENLEIARQNKSVEAVKQYCMEHPNHFYFNDVTSFALSTYNVHLWQAKPYYMNYMSLGDWIAFSPLWRKKLDQQGISNVKEALYEGENVYLLCSFDRGLKYLSALYDNVEYTEVDKIKHFKIYKLDCNNSSR